MWSPATSAMTAIVQKSSTPKAALDLAQKEVEEAVAAAAEAAMSQRAVAPPPGGRRPAARGWWSASGSSPLGARAAPGRGRPAPGPSAPRVVALRALVEIVGGRAAPARASAARSRPVRPGARLADGDPRRRVRRALARGLHRARGHAARRRRRAAWQGTRRRSTTSGQRLRAAVETNRQEGGARKEEIEVGTTRVRRARRWRRRSRRTGGRGRLRDRSRPRRSRPPPRPAAPPALLAFARGRWRVFFAARRLRRRSAAGLLVVVAVAVLLVLAMVGYRAPRLHDRRRGRAARSESGRRGPGDRRGARGGRRSVLASCRSATRSRSTPRPGTSTRSAGRSAWSGADGTVDEAGAGRRSLGGIAARRRTVLGVFAVLGARRAGLRRPRLRARGSAPRSSKHRQAYAYTFPALFGMLLLVFLPFLYGVALSFTDLSLYTAQAPMTRDLGRA